MYTVMAAKPLFDLPGWIQAQPDVVDTMRQCVGCMQKMGRSGVQFSVGATAFLTFSSSGSKPQPLNEPCKFVGDNKSCEQCKKRKQSCELPSNVRHPICIVGFHANSQLPPQFRRPYNLFCAQLKRISTARRHNDSKQVER